MANDRINLRCNQCGDELFLGKSYYDGFYYVNYGENPKSLEEKLNDFYKKHTYCNGSDLDGDFDICYETRETSKDSQIIELEEQINELESNICDLRKQLNKEGK